MRKDFLTETRGFTMLELLIVMGIVIVLVAAAGPAISNWVLKNRVDTKVASFRSTLAYAKSEALSRNIWVTVRENGSSWNTGWLLFTDMDNDGYMGSNDDILRADIFSIKDLSIEWANDIDLFSYGPRGVTNGGSQNTVRFCVADDTHHAFAKGITINAIGRTRIVKGVDVGCTP